MDTTKEIRKVPKLKELNKQNIQDLFYLLQPVSYTDKDHQADYYGYGFGNLLIIKQQAYIDVLKQSIVLYNTKHHLQLLFDSLDKDINYFPGFVRNDLKRKGQTEFWNSEFGKGLLDEWRWMLHRFVSNINKMIQI